MSRKVSPVNGVPLPRGKPFTKDNAKQMGRKGGDQGKNKTRLRILRHRNGS